MSYFTKFTPQPKMIQKFAAGAALAFSVIAAPAIAEPIMLDSSNVGDSFTINYDGFSDGATIDGLTASTTFTLTGVTDTTYLICPLLSGPSTKIVWTMKETLNAHEEARAGGDHRQAA